MVSEGQAIMRVAVPSGDTSVLARAPQRCYEPGAAWGAAGRIVIRICDRARIIGDPSGEVSLKLKGLGMFTPRGDAAMRRVVLRAARMLRRGAAREETLRRVRHGINQIGARVSGTYDTDVSETVASELDRWLRAAGLELIEANDEITC